MNYSKTFQKYARVLRSEEYSPLEIEEEKRLLKEYAEGSQEAFEKIVKAYLRFVIYVIKEFKIPSNLDIMDIVQEGNLGFMIGLSKFDSSKYDCRVSTYCVFWIKFFIKKALTLNAKLSNVFYNLSENDNIEERAAEEDIVEKNIRDKVYEDINKFVLPSLSSREQFIIKSYYGLEYPFIPKTLQEIASICHINCERVRQLRNAALDKLNKEVVSKLAHNL